MAQIILSNCFINIDGVDYSGQGTKAAISMSAETHTIQAFGDKTVQHIGGLLDWSMAFEFNADESVTGQTFFDMVGQTIPVEVRPSAGPVSPSNPSYEGDAVVTEYTPLDGEVGDVHKVSLSLVSAGDLSRVTAAVV